MGTVPGGTVGMATVLASWDQPVPDLEFVVAVGVAGVPSALLAAMLPAVLAARRDPLHELRVP